MNKAILRGNVGQDPKINYFQDGGKIAQFTLATTERGFKTRDGRDVPDVTTWHNIVVRQTGLAGVCEQFVKKGTPVLIVGKIRTREREDQNGAKHYVTEIIADEMELLGGQKREQAPAPQPEYRPTPANYQPMDDDMPV